MRLHGRHFDSENLFRLGRQFLDHILFQSPQHECAELFVEIFDLGFLIRVVQVEVVCKLDWGQWDLAPAYISQA